MSTVDTVLVLPDFLRLFPCEMREKEFKSAPATFGLFLPHLSDERRAIVSVQYKRSTVRAEYHLDRGHVRTSCIWKVYLVKKLSELNMRNKLL